jgi:hypothetical protein
MVMNEDISAGVKILLERGKTNPDEMKEEFGQWANLRDAVFEYKESKRRSAWLRGLTEHEIDLLFNMFNTVYRSIFDAWVMKTVLGAEEEDVIAQRVGAYQMAQGKRISNPHMLQNSIPPGSWQNVATQTSNTSVVSQQSLVARLKQELGIK